ncbi:RNAse Z [Thalassoporum mexicanum PCC 7367]|uniref:ribonuclease Z n=1 Tax=Thalassoporum mexicanum TaxID=3457544 RepID=UPI00029FD253|nr:ribonuclease Z [Pseudanabaena sp. PCC 7367]AFY69043.1 RNAse Z [Pseudanabaena sp. PCC 7367]
MHLTFLGTSSGVPTRSRNVSSIALRLPQRSEVWLFDCGEGTQHQIMRSDVRLSQISKIFITHMHGDHIFGLTGLLASCGMAGNAKRIDIYGPSGLGEYLDACQRYSETHLSYEVQVHRVKPGLVVSDPEFSVYCAPLKHRVTAYGYRVEEVDRPGRFDLKKAQAMNIPPGPVYAQLKRGETVQLDDGRMVDGKEFSGAAQPGRKLAYCTDTIYCDSAVDLAQDVDVLIHEATFAHQDAGLAYQRLHSTSTMAAQVALGANAKNLIMTHFSPRYAPGNAIQLNDLLAEARSIFANTRMAHDFMNYEIKAHTPVMAAAG